MPRKSGGAAPSTARAYVSSETPGKIESNGKDTAAAESASLALLEDENDLSIEDQLDRMDAKIQEEEQKLNQRHRGRSAESDDDNQDGESEEEPVQRSQGGDEGTAKLLAALSTVTERMSQLEQRIVNISEGGSGSDESDDDIPYDVGEIEEGFEAIKPTLNAMGKQLYAEVQQSKRAIQTLAESVRAAIDEIHVDRIREKFQIGSKEEDDIVAWAKDIGISYDNPRQLAKTIKLYRDTHKETARPAQKPRSAEGKPAGARTFDEDLVQKPGRRTFDDSWARAVRTVNKTIRERGLGAL